MEDTRNVINKYKGWAHEAIVSDLDAHGSALEIAIENTERDFNMGTIVRSANAFGVRQVHVIGRHQWNKRGAMATDKYLHVAYYAAVEEFFIEMKRRQLPVLAIDNIENSQSLSTIQFPAACVLVFGQEGPGISTQLAQKAEKIIAIEQIGSTRSINVGVAAGIVMYEWTRQQKLV